MQNRKIMGISMVSICSFFAVFSFFYCLVWFFNHDSHFGLWLLFTGFRARNSSFFIYSGHSWLLMSACQWSKMKLGMKNAPCCEFWLARRVSIWCSLLYCCSSLLFLVSKTKTGERFHRFFYLNIALLLLFFC